ncbi:hypothetical protein [Plantibacter sp. YIM 135249]|uniref:hypothetical protein n=1 Tax=Plantibacter sp. YIM 135249 TaxID=3423918 RepID=UPI003D34F662
MNAFITVSARSPESPLHAAIHGWDYPVSRDWMLLALIADSSEAKRLGKKFKPMKRPWPDRSTQQIEATPIPIEEARARIAHLGMKTA